jgi:hypothetical protein
MCASVVSLSLLASQPFTPGSVSERVVRKGSHRFSLLKAPVLAVLLESFKHNYQSLKPLTAHLAANNYHARFSIPWCSHGRMIFSNLPLRICLKGLIAWVYELSR